MTFKNDIVVDDYNNEIGEFDFNWDTSQYVFDSYDRLTDMTAKELREIADELDKRNGISKENQKG